MSEKNDNKDKSLPPGLSVLTGGAKSRASISEDTVARMKRTLEQISSSDWGASEWIVTVPTTGKTASVHFPDCDQEDAVLLRLLAIDYLIQYASPNCVRQVVRDGHRFILFLSRYKIHVEDVRSSIVTSYVDYLEHQNIGDAQRNSRIRAAAALYEACVENDLVQSEVKVVDFSYRFLETKVKRRAPDKCVVDALDRLFINLDNDIPLNIRTIYFVLRLIPNRISEVLGMQLDCLSYPNIDLFAVNIPTSKETALHIPVYNKYNFQFGDVGKIEYLFYKLLRMQQEVVRACEDSDNDDTDYLFYDPERHRVVSDADFNKHLAGVISKHGIRNADGSYPTVTSHMFRHVTIGERLRSEAYTPEDTMKESNHTNLDVTFSYGYMSNHDEAEHLGSITSAVTEEELGVASGLSEPSCKARLVNGAKYARLQSSPFTRIIPGFGLCQNASCLPQYAECVKCSHFYADPLYLDYFLEAHEIIGKKLDKFHRVGGASDAVAFEQLQLEIVDAYITLLSKNKISVTTKEGMMLYGAG